MKIKIKGPRPEELKDAGLRHGDIINTPEQAECTRNGVLRFIIVTPFDTEEYVTVQPENYIKL